MWLFSFSEEIVFRDHNLISFAKKENSTYISREREKKQTPICFSEKQLNNIYFSKNQRCQNTYLDKTEETNFFFNGFNGHIGHCKSHIAHLIPYKYARMWTTILYYSALMYKQNQIPTVVTARRISKNNEVF